MYVAEFKYKPWGSQRDIGHQNNFSLIQCMLLQVLVITVVVNGTMLATSNFHSKECYSVTDLLVDSLLSIIASWD